MELLAQASQRQCSKAHLSPSEHRLENIGSGNRQLNQSSGSYADSAERVSSKMLSLKQHRQLRKVRPPLLGFMHPKPRHGCKEFVVRSVPCGRFAQLRSAAQSGKANLVYWVIRPEPGRSGLHRIIGPVFVITGLDPRLSGSGWGVI